MSHAGTRDGGMEGDDVVREGAITLQTTANTTDASDTSGSD